MRPHAQGGQTISARQLWMLVAGSRTAVITTTLPVVTTGRAGRDAWLAAVTTTLAALLLAVLIASFARRLGRRSLAEHSQRVLGRTLGKVPALVVAALFAVGGYYQSRTFSDLIAVTALPNTPNWALALVTLTPPIFIAWRGLDGLGRSAEIALTLLGASFLVVIPLASAPELNWRWILPVLEHGWGPVLTSVPVGLFWSAAFSFVSVAAYPHLDQPQKLPGSLVLANLIAGAVLVVMAILVIGQFGPAEASRMTSPVYTFVKILQIGAVVRRLEILAVAVWVPAVGLATALLLWAAARMLAGVTGLQIRHAALLVGGAVLLASVWQEPDSLMLQRLMSAAALPALAGGVIAPMLLVGVAGALARPGRGQDRARRRARRWARARRDRREANPR